MYCGADDSYMRAMNVSTGNVVWMFQTDDRVISSALVDAKVGCYLDVVEFIITFYWYQLYSGI